MITKVNMSNNSTTHDSSKRKEREHSKVPPLLTGIKKKGCNISEVVMIELHSMDRIIIEDNFHFFY
jgi:hypothetical protein